MTKEKKESRRNVRLLHVFMLLALFFGSTMPAVAQINDEIEKEIWKQFDLGQVDYKRSKSYCQRLYAYYRFIDDGILYATLGYDNSYQHKLYRVYEGICELDIRYDKDEDEGAKVMVGRDLVHPEKKGKFIDFYELKPYTFLEKARRTPKYFTIETNGNTTRVYTKRGLAGTAVKDPEKHELLIDYNAIAPDSTLSINLLLIKARLNRAHANALYWYDETSEEYVPQGNLKRVFFDGDIDMNTSMAGKSVREVFNEHTEIYVDSVAYLTRDEYRADKKTTLKERRERCGFTDADIDRLKQKLGVPPLTAEQLQRIEDQRDWDDEYEQWKQTRSKTDKEKNAASRLKDENQ